MRIALFDLDHTVADARWRDNIMPPSETWDHYHSEHIHDKPFEITIDLINALTVGCYITIGFTMRPEKWRQTTNAWMMKYNVGLTNILMRANNDFEPAHTAKIALVRRHFTEEQIKHIQFIVDDREDVCQSFTDELGISSLQIRHRIS